MITREKLLEELEKIVRPNNEDVRISGELRGFVDTLRDEVKYNLNLLNDGGEKSLSSKIEMISRYSTAQYSGNLEQATNQEKAKMRLADLLIQYHNDLVAKREKEEAEKPEENYDSMQGDFLSGLMVPVSSDVESNSQQVINESYENAKGKLRAKLESEDCDPKINVQGQALIKIMGNLAVKYVNEYDTGQLLVDSLKAATDCVESGDMQQLNECIERTHGLDRSWGKVLGNALLAFAGAVLIAGAVAAFVMTGGISVVASAGALGIGLAALSGAGVLTAGGAMLGFGIFNANKANRGDLHNSLVEFKDAVESRPELSL